MSAISRKMNGQHASAVLRTLVLTDLVDSTSLVSRLGDERAFALLTRHDRLARDLLARYHGREIDKTDGFLLLFERPLDAVAYAVSYHRALHDLGCELGVPLAARAGIHLGEVFLRENSASDVALGAKPLEVEGLAKPVAARTMALAMGRQTLLTRAAFDVARRAAVGASELPTTVRWQAHGAYLLKGVDEPLEVFEAGEEGLSPLTAPPDSEKARRAAGDSTITGWRPAPGQEIPGRPTWVLEGKLGQGGFGEVWLARHRKTHDPLVFKFCFEAERLKGLKREVVLFRLLKEALGDRNDIARVRDWNFERAPFFLEVDYSAGGSLVDWAAHRGGIGSLPLGERLELVAQVSEALAAAHSVGVLHKDLKPANILIEEGRAGCPQAKLTDFGIGLLTDTGRLAEFGITALGVTELATATGTAASGTVQYMAPEVVEGRPVTVQADIWALGVVLYQLVVGDLQRSLAPGWEREVEDELLREDIAACVDGSPARRLASAGDLALRLRRLGERRTERDAQRQALAAEARARRRRRILLPAAAVLGLFALAMTVQSWRVAREAARAEREAATAREVSRFLVDLFELADQADQARNRGDTITARELLERGASRVARELADQPLTQARLMDTIGQVFLKLGLPGKAEPLLRDALEIRRRLLGTQHPDYAASLDSAAQLAARQKDYTQAEQLLASALEVKERSFGPRDREVASTLAILADLYKAQGRFAEARPLDERVAGILRTGSRGAAPAGTGASPPARIIELLREAALPADVRTLLGAAPDPRLALVLGRHAVYVVDLDGVAPPTAAVLAADEEVLAPASDGVVMIRSGARLVLRDYFPSDSEVRSRTVDRVVAEGVEPEDQVAVDRSGRTFAWLSRGLLKAFEFVPGGARQLLAAPVAAGATKSLVIGTRHLAWLEENRLRVWSLESGRELLHVGGWDGRAEAVAISDTTGEVAVGGWFDEVFLFDVAGGRARREISSPGHTLGLLFLPDHPTLAVAKEGRLLLWREGPGVVARFEANAADFRDLRWGSSGLLVYDSVGQKLFDLAYRSFPVEDRGTVAGVELWAMAADAAGRRLFLGSSDGRLHRFDLDTSTLVSRPGHTQGLTSLVVLGDQVATASDDKTIALWNADRLEVVARSKAHGYLVNNLFWESASQTLWSASSDRSIKAWSLPGFTAKEEIQLGEGSKSSIFIDSQRGFALVGTWNSTWNELERRGGVWRLARSREIPSAGVYCIAHQPGAEVLMIVGVRPGSLWLHDLRQGRSWRLDPPTGDVEWAVPQGADRIVVVGRNQVLAYRFRRSEGQLRYELSAGLSTDLGEALIAAPLAEGTRVAVGNGKGNLLLFDTAKLPLAVLESRELR